MGKTLKDVPTANLKCRSLGHAWDPTLTLVETRGRKQVLVVSLECMRCVTGRTDVIERRTGVREDRVKYEYAAGYLVKGRAAWGSQGSFNAQVRRTLYERLAQP